MITELTERQKQMIDEVRDEYLSLYYSLPKYDDSCATEIINMVYKSCGYKPPLIWLYDGSPVGLIVLYKTMQNIWQNIGENIWQNIARNIEQNIRENIRESIGQNIRRDIRENIWQNIARNIWQNIKRNIGENIGRNIRENIRQNIEQNIGENIWQNIARNIEQNIEQNIGRNIRENIEQNIGRNIRENIRENIRQDDESIQLSLYIAHDDLFFIAYYDYFFRAKLLGTHTNKYFDVYKKLPQSGIFNVIPTENICFVSTYPRELHLNNAKQLHHDGGYAIEWNDGYGIYYLNGVEVPDWLAITPKHQLNGKMLLDKPELRDNVEVRREFVRKIGVERCINQLGWCVIEKQGTYELGTVEVTRGLQRKYLKMLNPSVKGVWHIEAVHPDCNTVQEALNYRAYGDKNMHWQPIYLT